MSIPYLTSFKPIHIFLSVGVTIGLLSFAFATDAFAGGGGDGGGIENLFERTKAKKSFKKKKGFRYKNKSYSKYRSKGPRKRWTHTRPRSNTGLRLEAPPVIPPNLIPLPPSVVRLTPAQIAQRKEKERREAERREGEALLENFIKQQKQFVKEWSTSQQPQGTYQPDTFIGQGDWKDSLRPDPPKKSIPKGLFSPWDPPPEPVTPVPFPDISTIIVPDISTINDVFGHFLNALSGKKAQLASAAHTLINVLWKGSAGEDFNDAVNKGTRTAVKSAGALLGAATMEAIAIAAIPETGPLSVVTIPAAKFVGSVAGDAFAGVAYDAINSADVQVEDLAPMTEWPDQAVP